MKKLTLITAIILTANLMFAQWEMTYPQPCLNSLGPIYFYNENLGWVAIWNGGILHTQDGGENWIESSIDSSLSIKSIHFGNENTGWAGGNCLLRTQDGGNTWNSVTSFPGSNAQSIHASGNDSCWVSSAGSSDGNIFFTSDGGLTWETQYSGNSIWSLSFINNSCGWAVGLFGTILKTSDGGITWQSLPTFSQNWLKKVCFTDSNTGYITDIWGMGPQTIFKTNDGGLSWDSIYSAGGIKDMSFQNADTGFFISYYNFSTTRVYRTLNGGISWEYTEIPVSNSEISCSIFNNFGKVWVTCGMNPAYIYNSENMGETWNHNFPEMLTTENLHAVDFSDEMSGWAAGDHGTIINTTNGGDSWTVESSVTTQNLMDIQFANENTGWIVGDSGTILNTQNGGLNWSIQNAPLLENFIQISVVDENTCWVISEYSFLKTINGGTNWGLVNLPFSYNKLIAVHFNSAVDGWLLTFGTLDILYHTLDGGLTWEPSLSLEVDFLNGRAEISFTDADHGFICGAGGVLFSGNFIFLYKTVDGGLNWQDFSPVLGGGYLGGFSVNDDLHGFIAIGDDWADYYIYETYDGCETWELCYSLGGIFSIDPEDICFSDPLHAFMVGSQGLIMKWTDPSVDVKEMFYRNSFGLSVYPNPAKDKITFEYQVEDKLPVTINIYNYSGQCIQSFYENSYSESNGQINFDISKLSAGIYICQVQIGNERVTKKIIKVK